MAERVAEKTLEKQLGCRSVRASRPAVRKILNVKCNRKPFGELCRIAQSWLSLQSQRCVALFSIHHRREGSKDSSPDRNPAWHRRLCSVDNSNDTLKCEQMAAPMTIAETVR